ncbi:MAG TPA: hypothetical protein VGH62_09890 [Bradyrhizobium sp.]
MLTAQVGDWIILRHDPHLGDDFSQRLRQAIIPGGEIARDQLIQTIQIAQILLGDFRMHADYLRRFLGCGESGLCSFQLRPQRRHSFASFIRRDGSLRNRSDQPVNTSLCISKLYFKLRPRRGGTG